MSEKFIDWEEYLYVIDIVAEIINCHMYCLRPEFDKLDFVYGIPRGGLIPATILSYKFNIPVLNYISQNIITEPEKKLICVIDDILDSGKTLDKELTTLSSMGFRLFEVFTLYAKPKGLTYFLNSSWKDRNWYIRQIPDDCWIHFPYEQNCFVKDTVSVVKQPGT